MGIGESKKFPLTDQPHMDDSRVDLLRERMMAGDARSWIMPNTTKLNSFDIARPTVENTLSSGLVVRFKPTVQLNPDDLERWINIYRTVCYGTGFEISGFACIINELLEVPLSVADVENNRTDLHNLLLFILDSLDDRKYGSTMVTRPFDELEHENFLFAHFWRSWGIAVRSAISGGHIDERVPLRRMSDLLVQYAGSPRVLYKSNRHPEGQSVALPIWVRNWFHHTENTLEPVPPSRHEIRRASIELARLSRALEMSDEERRQETRREENEHSTRIEYGWLNMAVFLSEEMNLFWVYQLGMWSGWKIEVPYSEYSESGKDKVDFALKLKQRTE